MVTHVAYSEGWLENSWELLSFPRSPFEHFVG